MKICKRCGNEYQRARDQIGICFSCVYDDLVKDKDPNINKYAQVSLSEL